MSQETKQKQLSLVESERAGAVLLNFCRSSGGTSLPRTTKREQPAHSTRVANCDKYSIIPTRIEAPPFSNVVHCSFFHKECAMLVVVAGGATTTAAAVAWWWLAVGRAQSKEAVSLKCALFSVSEFWPT